MQDLGASCYAIGGVLYLVLTGFFLFNRRGFGVGAMLIAATTVTAVWYLFHAFMLRPFSSQNALWLALEIARELIWIVVILALMRHARDRHVGRYVVVSASIAGALAFAAGWGSGGIALLGRNHDLIMLLLLALAGFGLGTAVVSSRRDVNNPIRRALHLTLGVTSLFAFDIAFYAWILLGEIPAEMWIARAVVTFAMLPLIAISVRRNRDWGLTIFVSRQVVYTLTAVVGIGSCLLLAGIVMNRLRGPGPFWEDSTQVALLLSVLVGAVLLLASEKFRARAKVFLNKHFFQYKYDYRLEWLRLISALSHIEAGSAREVVLKAMAQIVFSPRGHLWVQDRHTGSFRHVASLDYDEELPTLDEADPVVEFMRKDGWLIDLREYESHRRRYGDLVLPGWLLGNPDFWLVVPLFARDRLIGFIALEEAPGPPLLNFEDRDLLKTVGNHVAIHIEQERSERLLAEAQQFEAYNRLTAYLMHDLNNLIAQQSLIVENAERHKRNPAFIDDAMSTIANSVNRMKRVMLQLKQRSRPQPDKETEARFVVSAAVDRCADRRPVPHLATNGVMAAIAVDVEECTANIANLVRNAQDATGADGAVSVELVDVGDAIEIRVSDDGCGMSAEFVRDRLFRPFDSTKGSQGMGVGAYQAREFARGLGGDLSVESWAGRGTTMVMRLPARTAQRRAG